MAWDWTLNADNYARRNGASAMSIVHAKIAN